MCRFLIVRSEDKISPEKLLRDFAQACQKSIDPDGEQQKDGYGVAWQVGKDWQTKKSLSPIWTDQDSFSQIPDSNLFVAHARSSGFSQDKDILEYNQPFIDSDLCFVFNGMIRKISIKFPLEGKIGSQKLFSLIKRYLKSNKIEKVLPKIRDLILEKAEQVPGMNIALIQDNKIHVLCQYLDNKEYFTLHYYQDNNLTIISSEVFGSYSWKSLKKGESKSF